MIDVDITGLIQDLIFIGFILCLWASAVLLHPEPKRMVRAIAVLLVSVSKLFVGLVCWPLIKVFLHLTFSPILFVINTTAELLTSMYNLTMSLGTKTSGKNRDI